MIVDANILVSALLGRSMPLLIACAARGLELFVPSHQLTEARLVAAKLAGVPRAFFEQTISALVEELPVSDYLAQEDAARARLGEAGQPDWPLVAAALERDDEIWSNDRDLFGVGIAVWSTRNIGYAGT